MGFLACILACIWPSVSSAAQSFLGTAVLNCLTSLSNWVVPQVRTLVSSCCGDFEEVPDSTTAIVGAEKTLDEIRAYLNDDSVGIIGIYGMGGAGKTTLLRKINNDLSESGTARGKFDLGIWVTVSKEVNIPEIQKEIARRLKLDVSGDESQVAKTLFDELSRRRFLMLLDDLWAKLDLVKVGIPVPTNRRKCKIAFTTRSLDVCGAMDATKNVEVKRFDYGPSWKLFRSKVGTEVDLDNPPIQRLAKQVVHKCGGLPLALITVGRAMANRRQPGEWELAVKDLDHKAEELGDMKDEVLSRLKLSYDYLKNDKMRSALLYCAMYPEDSEIERDELIGHWIGEGMLDDDDVDDARNRGHRLITDLQHSCLLEACSSWKKESYVRMHDSVRDLALWLNKTDRMEYDEVYGFVAGKDLTEGADTQRREHIRRIWMRGLDLTASPPCLQNCPPKSWTLLLNLSRLEPCLLQGIFNCMRTLRVLDLNWARHLKELPIEIRYLQDLQYLNLSRTEIRSLPKELGKLVRLRQLYLSQTERLSSIPREAIVGLLRLQVLHMWRSGYEWRSQDETPAMEDRMVDDEENKQPSSSDTGAAEEGSGGRQLEVSDLEGLQRLQEWKISLESPHALQQLSRSESVRRRTRLLEVKWKYQVDDGPLRMIFTQRFDQLRHLELAGAHHPWVGDLRISLDRLPCLKYLSVSNFNCKTTATIVLEGANAESFRRLKVYHSSGWKALELVGNFPGLEVIEVRECDGMEELLLDEENEGTGSQQDTIQEQLNDIRFPKLSTLVLIDLRDLKSIGRRPLSLPSLENIIVRSSPQLRRLPLGPGSVPKLKEICGDQHWWDGLEWGSSGDDPNIRNIFAPFFRLPWHLTVS